MNIQEMQLEVPKHEARELWIEYRSSVKRMRDRRRMAADMELEAAHTKRTAIEREEDELRAAYRAISLGQRVICVPQVIRAAGFTTEGFPVLAIARSEWEWCHYRPSETFVKFMPTDSWRERCEEVFSVPVPVEHHGKRARALVPPIPPRFRPESLDGYYTLFEAEWQPEPPVDPILLKRVGKTMFVVVAQWDLTAVERAVLEGRFTR